MFCRVCGVEIASEARFCYKCGARIIKHKTTVDSEQKFESEQTTLIIRSSGVNSDSATVNNEQEEQIPRDYSRKTKKENLTALVSILTIIGIVIVVGIIQESENNSNTVPTRTETSINDNTQPEASGGSDIELVSETNQIIARLESQGRTYWTECVARPIFPIPGYLTCFYPVIETCNVSFFDSYYYAQDAVENGRIVDLGDVWYGEDAETGYGVVVSAPSYEDSCFVDAMAGLGLQDWWVSN